MGLHRLRPHCLCARLALTVGGVLFARLVTVHGATTGGYRPVPRWTRRWAWAAVALPMIGWAGPHLFWLFGVPLGISAEKLGGAHRDLATTRAGHQPWIRSANVNILTA